MAALDAIEADIRGCVRDERQAMRLAWPKPQVEALDAQTVPSGSSKRGEALR